MEKHRVSRLSYLFVHLHLLSFDSFSDSSHLCFSICFKSLTSKLPSKIVLQFHQSKYNAEPLAPAPGTMIFIAMSGNMTDFRLICQSNCVPLCIFIQALDGRICSRLLFVWRTRLASVSAGAAGAAGAAVAAGQAVQSPSDCQHDWHQQKKRNSIFFSS